MEGMETMRTRQRALVVLAGLLMIVAVAATGSPAGAQEATPDWVADGQVTAERSTRENGDLVVRLPVQASTETAVAAPAPTTSPAAERRYFVTSLNITCRSGRVCAVVPYSNGWYVFDFYYYGRYYLSWWYGNGFAINNQTGGAAARLLDQSGGQVICVPAGSTGYGSWTPIWSIRLTESRC